MSRSNNPLAGQDAPVPSILRGDSPAAYARYFRICKQKAATAARMADRPLAAFWLARALETGVATDNKASSFLARTAAIYRQSGAEETFKGNARQ